MSSTKMLLAAALCCTWLFASAASAEADLERGEQLFGLCGQCHGSAGEGNQDYLAPAIAGLSEWYVVKQLESFREGLRGTHPDDIGGMRMRPMSRWLTGDEDVVNVSAYVASLPAQDPVRTVEGDVEKGKALYAPCTACHAVDGAGNEALNGAPVNRHTSDWYLYTQLSNFRAGVRGANPLDQWGVMMRPMAMTLADDQAVKDVIAYIMTLQGAAQEGQ